MSAGYTLPSEIMTTAVRRTLANSRKDVAKNKPGPARARFLRNPIRQAYGHNSSNLGMGALTPLPFISKLV